MLHVKIQRNIALGSLRMLWMSVVVAHVIG